MVEQNKGGGGKRGEEGEVIGAVQPSSLAWKLGGTPLPLHHLLPDNQRTQLTLTLGFEPFGVGTIWCLVEDM